MVCMWRVLRCRIFRRIGIAIHVENPYGVGSVTAMISIPIHDPVYWILVLVLGVGPAIAAIYLVGSWKVAVMWLALIVLIMICNAVCPPGIGHGGMDP